MKKLSLILGILVISIVACKSKKEVAQEENTSTPKMGEFKKNTAMAPFNKETGQDLIGKRWKAIEIMGQTVEMPEGMKQEPYLTFKRDGSIAANGGCNGIFGEYKLGVKNFIEMSNFSQTERACDFSSFEEILTQALTLGKQYIITDEDHLQIIIGKRAPLAKFEAVYLD